MKSKSKKFFWYIIGIVLFCIIVGVVYNLFFMVEAKKLAQNSVSEIRQNFFVAEDDLSNINISSGYRENPYSLDGVHNDVVPFGVVVFRTSLANIAEPSYNITIGESVYQGIFERNPYDNTFVADLETAIDDDSQIHATIYIEDDTYDFTLQNLSSGWEIDCYEAFDIGLEALDECVQSLKKGNSFGGECYIKVISDPNNMLDIFYWYVAIVDKEGNTHAVVVDSSSGKILSQN